MLDSVNERAVKGDNNPPAHITWAEHAESLVEIAEGLGEITTEEQAESVGRLAADAKKAAADAEKARKAEKQPHLDAGKAVDANYKPITERLNRVAGVTRALLTPWIEAQRKAEQEAAAEKRRIAQEADEAARRIAAEIDQADIEQVEKAAAAEIEAKALAQAAKVKAKPTTVEGVTFRTYRTGEVTDRVALLTHIAKADPGAMTALAVEWMKKAVRDGADDIPGVTITTEKRAV